MKGVAGALIVFFIVIQFVPRRENKTYEGVPETDITKILDVPPRVEEILTTSCYDCHSSSTRYPWYHQIQPISLYLDDHIEDGQKELNFSEFKTYSSRRQKSKLRSSLNQIEDGEMPLASYTLIHQDAKLTDDEIKILEEWINTVLEE